MVRAPADQQPVPLTGGVSCVEHHSRNLPPPEGEDKFLFHCFSSLRPVQHPDGSRAVIEIGGIQTIPQQQGGMLNTYSNYPRERESCQEQTVAIHV